MTDNKHQEDHSISPDWTDLKQNLDPSFSYLIFEKDVGRGKTDDFEKVVSILSPFKKMIRGHNLYGDRYGFRCLLAVQLQPRQKNRIVREIMNLKLPKDIIFYIYWRRNK